MVCLADWVLLEDLGFLGGLGTDPNSMIPFALLAIGGHLALTRVTAYPAAHAVLEQAAPSLAWRWPSAGPAAQCRPLLAARTMAALGGVSLIILGGAPMAMAQASPGADPILAESIVGSSVARNYPAPGITLTDQYGRTMTLEGMRGRVVLLSFVDPGCPPDCPIVEEFGQAVTLLGTSAHQVELVGIVSSRVYRPARALEAFGRRERLNRVPDWRYLTGTLADLRPVWRAYGIGAHDHAGTATSRVGQVYVIDPAGHVQQEFRAEPGLETAAIKSSFAVLFADAARQAIDAQPTAPSAAVCMCGAAGLTPADDHVADRWIPGRR